MAKQEITPELNSFLELTRDVPTTEKTNFHGFEIPKTLAPEIVATLTKVRIDAFLMKRYGIKDDDTISVLPGTKFNDGDDTTTEITDYAAYSPNGQFIGPIISSVLEEHKIN
ncbi:MAG: hypothetical protein UR28_C0032G0005 [Candidatus Peregrinibacteria bacterium GW2011_GWF2_33_10]|nr:MAG: hypothetical protein UR28_C0032G0005 [Candidatus Peregrinibacteria bacterium GW2011_GWF2_33_10]OGJ44442.1 MAG: hypothetical protein A2272_01175 [Candidatus Peregrinibacteria bacterium RIFOXYA12_FULL_33_12]OGJ45008.1 MAG: hypothetical protein A2263_03030 [Candidatus Peregrinibacteria bacterium RIFOXYA2_FULL_33_21]OGJ51706.1 MAG: hypothetical protein A2307_05350 [Candidatus Peregrinibacteria bacterium RIFOXYB2_FULL_33_20]